VARTVDSKRLRPAAVADAVATVVQRGGTVIFPTDTVYGIGCDPVRGDAVEAIFALKGRPRTKPLALYFGSVAEMLEYAPENPLGGSWSAADPSPPRARTSRANPPSTARAAPSRCPRPICASTTGQLHSEWNQRSSMFVVRSRSSCARERSA
jgi:tRNA A37 threonylcarbamoyladenosine synthetase subunit TsaC/SUA5/YrdC